MAPAATTPILVLLVTLSISDPLEFSIFPSLLLLVTLLRLGLNVNSTRLILSHGHAGQVIAAFGNALGPDLHTTVLPFILRGVRLIGVNANSPLPLRQHIWQRIATDLKPKHLASIAREIRLDDLPAAFQSLIDNHSKGRIVVALK